MGVSWRPRGNMIIEIPSRAHTLRCRAQPRYRAYRVLRRVGVSPKRLRSLGFSGIKMLCLPSDWVVGVLERSGVQLHEISEHRGPRTSASGTQEPARPARTVAGPVSSA